MKRYMVFSRVCGAEDGACLVFANNEKEARKLGYKYAWFDDYIDVAAKLIKDESHLDVEADQEKLKNNIPHVIESPATCPGCDLWGGEFFEDETCSLCS